MFSRFHFRLFVCLGILLPALTAPPALAATRPHILLILCDDLGYGDLSSFGATDLRSPHIDALMARSLRFDQFYANCTVCSPTRASLMTGRFPDLVGVPGVIRQHAADSWGYLDPAAIALPQQLKRAEYHTAMIGKWHLGYASPNLPNDRGFDFFHGFLGDMMDDYWTHLRGGENWMRRNREVITPEGHATDLFTDWTLDFLQSRRESETAFFLYLAYNAPHFPIQPPPEWLERVRMREPQLSEKRAKNVAFIEHLDHNIGRVLKALDDTDLAEKTLIVFSSDNGGSLSHAQSNGDLRGGKQDHWEGGIRVPTCVSWPGEIAPGRTDAPAMTMDFYPTFCELAELSVDHAVEGTSLLPLLRTGSGKALQNRHLLWVRREGNPRYQGRAYYAIRKGPWKLQQSSPFEPMELFNLEKDPRETTPVAGEDAIRRDLSQQLMRHLQEAGRVPWQPADPHAALP